MIRVVYLGFRGVKKAPDLGSGFATLVRILTEVIPNKRLSLCPGTRPVPNMFPSDVWEFQMPMMRPRFPLPNQLAMTVTTPGQPVDWNMPHATWRAGLDKTQVFFI